MRAAASVVAVTEPTADPRHARTRRRPSAWRVGTPLVAVVGGALFAVSAVNSEGADLRPGRYDDLPSLVQAEKNQTTALTRRVARLEADTDRMSKALGDREVSRYQERIQRLQDPAGLSTVTGPAVRVTLDDASPEVIEEAVADDPDTNRNDYVVHQQDIQAVVNAMWRAGAEAVTIQGQRVVTTTGIKCEGNSVTLHGVPYPPPYEIVGVGDRRTLDRALADDDYLEIYRSYARAPGGGVSWDVEGLDRYAAPGYSGLVDREYAQPLEG